jgi:hypothetical protein
MCVPATAFVSLQQLAAVAAAIGALNAGYSAWAQRIDHRLGELERLSVGDRRVQTRLHDRLAAWRTRLVVKRVVVFIAGVLAMLGGGILAFAPAPAMQAATVLISMAGASMGATGCVLLFVEATCLDQRTLELQRYADRLNASADEAAKLRQR